MALTTGFLRAGAVLFAVCLGIAAASTSRAAGPVLTFGVVPQQSASQLAKAWMPLVRHLAQQTGHDIKFVTAKDIPAFEACLALGAYDIAYMNPYHYTVYSAQNGYKAIAKQAKKKLKGLVVARKDSPVRGLENLHGGQAAFPSPAAFGASVIPQAVMRQQGLDVEPVYVRSHDSVYRSVAAGHFPAGGGVLRTFGNLPKVIKDQLRIIYETDAYTPHAFAIHPELNSDAANAIRDVMLQLGAQKPQVLQPLGMTGLEAAADADWDDVRRLELRSGQTQIVTGGRNACHSG